MPTALRVEPPASSLLNEFRRRGSFVDCYALEVPASVTQAQFIEAFYTTPLFKAERLVLRTLAATPSTDRDAGELAAGTTDSFAIWRVADRRPDQLLLTDRTGRTSSWLMSVPDPASRGAPTRLFFGSALTGRTATRTGKQKFSIVFHALLGLHDLYSRRLLQAAAAKLQRTGDGAAVR